jgi:hypothetical protein
VRREDICRTERGKRRFGQDFRLLRGLAEQLLSDYDAGQRALFDKTRKTLPKLAYLVESKSTDLRKGLQEGVKQLLAAASKIDQQVAVSLDDVRSWKSDAINATNGAIDLVDSALDKALVQLDGYASNFDKAVKDRQLPKTALASLWEIYNKLSGEVQNGVKDYINPIMADAAKDIGAKKKAIIDKLEDIKSRAWGLTVSADDAKKRIDGKVDEIATSISPILIVYAKAIIWDLLPKKSANCSPTPEI